MKPESSNSTAGRTFAEAHLLGDWSKSKPDQPGVYEIRCAETGHEPERVSVYRKRINGDESLWVSDCLGLNPLDHYHDNLINIEWRKVA